MATVLDWSILDGMAFALDEGSMPRSAPELTAARMGPVVEYGRMCTSRNGEWPRPSTVVSTTCEFLPELEACIGSTPIVPTSPGDYSARPFEIVSLPADNSEYFDSAAYGTFAKRMESSVRSVLNSVDDCAVLVAAFEELVSNVYEHSEAVETGILGYCVHESGFEFVVSDAGVGVLDSLRRNPKYESLSQDGQALALAVQRGVTRHEVKRGDGFGDLFKILERLAGELRLHSGVGVLKLLDTEQRLREASHIAGFTISAFFPSRT